MSVHTTADTPDHLLRRDANGDGAAFLKDLGERVRRARAQRGMSRKILARESGLSERYLAQLEGGSGNASVLVLRQVATAMDMALAELVSDGPERSVEATLLLQLLDRLSPAELAEAQELLHSRFAAAACGQRRGRIALIGLRGAGKSTLGQRLASRLNLPFIELDGVVEEIAGTPISEIFALYGQSGFRRYERRALETTIKRYERAVIAAGGGLVAEPASLDLLLSACFTIWLQAGPEEHMQRVMAQGDSRPMAESREAMEDLRQILVARTPLYAKADVAVNTARRTVEESLGNLLAVVPAELRAAS